MAEVVYQPEIKETQLTRFTRFVENNYNIQLRDYFELHEWSYKNCETFWECVWKFCDIRCSTPYTQVLSTKHDFVNDRWFIGARLNHTENIFKFRDSRLALIAIDDLDNTQYMTYEQMYLEVKTYMKALKSAGLKKGDVVACYMPNKLEQVLAFLATAAIGAQWSGGQPLFGVEGILFRFQQDNPKILFTSGNFLDEGKEVEMDTKLPQIVKGLPSLKKVVYVPSQMKGRKEYIPQIPNCVPLSEFLAVDSSGPIDFEQFPFDHSLTICYTSGTTDSPKRLVHPAGAFICHLLQSIMQDTTRDDNQLHCTTGGWISWHIAVKVLHAGGTLILYEGDPYMSSATRFWDIVDRFGVTSTMIVGSTLEKMLSNGHVPTTKHSLKTLKQILAYGCILKNHAGISNMVKGNLSIISTYGSTEPFGLVSGFDTNLPAYSGESQGWNLGMDVRIVDDNGQALIGRVGEIVLAGPYPGLPIINDTNEKIFKEKYLTRHPGYWSMGDDAILNPITKGIVVYGRSDESMYISSGIITMGQRIACSEIDSALEGFPGVEDSVCVSHFFNSKHGERVILFVQLSHGLTLTRELQDEIKRTVEAARSSLHVPHLVIQVPDIPYNFNGKKMNGLVKKLINKRPVANTNVLKNPAAVEFYKNLHLDNLIN